MKKSLPNFCRALYALLLALCGYALPAWSQSSLFNGPAEMLQNSMHNLFISSNGRYYIQTNGSNTGFNYWWNANGLDALVDGYLRSRSSTYTTRMKNLLYGIKATNGNTYLNYFYDDMEWMAISTLRAYQHTGDTAYMNAANILWADIQTGIHPERGGAIQWNKGTPNSFNACANAPAVILAARLYQQNGNAATLTAAQNIYNWTKSVLVNPTTGAVYDSYDAGTNTVNTNPDWVFSYNVGTWIGAALELYQVTGNSTYMDDAVRTAEYAMNTRLYNGVFFTNETGGGDGGLFKGIFIRYFTLLAREGNLPAATRQRYTNALKTSAQALNGQGINPANGLVNPVWTTQPGATTDYSTQLSGVMMLEAAATLDQAFVYKDLNYGGYSAGFTPGSYTYNDIIARGALNDDITSFTLPEGYSITLYQDDNYAGANATFTANTPWVGASWNDLTSSLRVNRTGGDGLKGEYYQGLNFNTFKLSRNDENINFNWGNGSPDYTIRPDSFSARWTGRIKPRYTETYTFYLNSDNGRRLWINNQLLIDQWIDNWNVEYTATITLTADQLYDIRLEYFEHNGGAACKLEWSSPSQTREVVPASRFYTPPAAARKAAPAIITAEDKDVNMLLTASPNPLSDRVRIQVANAGTAARLQVQVYNLGGAPVKSLQLIENGQQADLAGLPAGMYILQVRTGNKIFTKKVVKH